MNVYPFIEAEKAGRHHVARACVLLEVSRAAIYEWSKHIPSQHDIDDEALSRGSPELLDALIESGLFTHR